MALVNYSSSSDSEDESKTELCRKAKKYKLDKPNPLGRLPLPSAITNISRNKTTEHVDNPEMHSGRIRSFEHERGNWASFVYIPVNINVLDKVQSSIRNKLSEIDAFINSEDIHISLTKTVILRHHWIDSFIKSIRSNLNYIKGFSIEFRKINVYCNEERTRTFLGLTIDQIYNSNLLAISNILDDILVEYKLQKFYKDPSFHASILWTVGDYENEIKEYLPRLQGIFDDIYEKEPKIFHLDVKGVQCKTGNKIYSIKFC